MTVATAPDRDIAYLVRRTIGEVLITVGVVLLLFASWQLWWTDVESNAAARTSIDAFYGNLDDPKNPEKLDAKGMPITIGEDGVFGIIRIPRFGKDWVRPLVENTDWYPLTRGVGHYKGTVGPGTVGNFALAGHRTTYGRPFHNIDLMVPGDKIIVETKSTYFVYEMTASEIVAPWNMSVIAPVPDKPGVKPTEAMITLTSCHPKFSAAQRFIVHGKLLMKAKRADGLPGEIWAVPDGAVQ